MPALRVIGTLERIIKWWGKPTAIRYDNVLWPGIRRCGPDCMGAAKQNITLQYIHVGQPQQHAYVERFNRSVRHERIDQHLFESLDYARRHRPIGYGVITMSDLIWGLVALRPDSN